MTKGSKPVGHRPWLAKFALATVGALGVTFTAAAEVLKRLPGYTGGTTAIAVNTVNGQPVAISGNGEGIVRDYEWRIDAADLFPGRNVIRFVAPRNAAYHNGLCIYDDALVPGAVSAHVVLEIEEDHHQGFLP